MSFKVGDRVRCVNKGETHLSAGWKEGKEFVIKEIVDLGVNGNAYFPDYGSGVLEESLELVTPEFKVGDRVRMKEDCEDSGFKKGEIVTIIEGIDVFGRKHLYAIGDKTNVCSCQEKWELVLVTEPEPKMDKYTELKTRIDTLNANTTLEEFGKLLLEVGSNKYYLSMPTAIGGCFEIQNIERERLNNYEIINSPCDAIPILKKEFTWLLEHSQYKDTRKEELEKLKAQVAELNKRIEEMEG